MICDALLILLAHQRTFVRLAVQTTFQAKLFSELEKSVCSKRKYQLKNQSERFGSPEFNLAVQAKVEPL